MEPHTKEGNEAECFPLLFQIYMSPEVILCRGHSTKADIYSLGATLIHMQTGTPPWVKRYPRSAYPSYLYIVSGGSTRPGAGWGLSYASRRLGGTALPSIPPPSE